MSWDVLLMRFPEDFNGDFDEIPNNWEPEELFTKDYFAKELNKIFPEINTEDKTWMTLDSETFSIELNIGDDEPISNIMLHVRGDDMAIHAIELLCKTFNLQALDTTESELIDFSKNTNDGFAKWREYRNLVLEKNK
jgi:hypothetical protein